MCGIAGFFDQSGLGEDAGAVAGRMIDRLAHRGPDDRGVWVDRVGIALAHRRLSIIDLSPAGHQPMLSASGRYVVSYNGEIFNWADLRAELPPPDAGYRGHSDTEIFLRGLEIWGLEATLAKLIGFFAIALWDREERRLTLLRDRLGIKPLYWGQFGSSLLFGSELSAFAAHPACGFDLNRDALAAYLRTAYVPAPMSIWRNIHKLEPGGRLDIGPDFMPRVSRFWDVRDAIRAGKAARRQKLPSGAIDEWHDLLQDAVARRMVADVPLGAFLSGGIDSSTIVALMQAASSRKVKSYAIGFHEAGYDEAPFARAVAAQIGSDHTEFYVGASDALSMVPKLATIYDEPFADSSQIATALVCQLARREVTVALSGDGGDELFGGYNRYRVAERLWPRLAPLPAALRRLAAGALTLPSPNHWDRLLRPVLPRALGQAGDKIHKLASVLAAPDLDALYLRLISQWADPGRLVIGGTEASRLPDGLPVDLGFMEHMQARDMLTYLPDDILTKVDRASMAVALEVRVPFLDHRLVEKSWTLPADAKLSGGTGKWLLREILYRYVPRALLERPKMGFGVPIDRWLRGPLKDWAAALLDPATLRSQGYLRSEPITRAWNEHQSGRRNHQYALWTVLMFQSWLENQPLVTKRTADFESSSTSHSTGRLGTGMS
jgi:asparagine synthase (glutamine-hydrolysing)